MLSRPPRKPPASVWQSDATAHCPRADVWATKTSPRGRGKRLAGFAVDRLVAQSDIKGPAAVIRWFHSPELRDISERLVSGFG